MSMIGLKNFIYYKLLIKKTSENEIFQETLRIIKKSSIVLSKS